MIAEPFEADHFVLRLHAGSSYRVTATGEEGRGREALDDPHLLLSAHGGRFLGGAFLTIHESAAGDAAELLVTISDSDNYDLTVLAGDRGIGDDRLVPEPI